MKTSYTRINLFRTDVHYTTVYTRHNVAHLSCNTSRLRGHSTKQKQNGHMHSCTQNILLDTLLGKTVYVLNFIFF